MGEDKRVHIFPKEINPKGNVIVQLENDSIVSKFMLTTMSQFSMLAIKSPQLNGKLTIGLQLSLKHFNSMYSLDTRTIHSYRSLLLASPLDVSSVHTHS